MKNLKSFNDFLNESLNENDEYGRYLTLSKLANVLKISLTDEGKEKIDEDGLTEQNFDEYFEDIMANSGYRFYFNLGEAGFGLTSAPGFTENYDEEDNTDDFNLYYFEPYMIYDFTEILKTDGSVYFVKH